MSQLTFFADEGIVADEAGMLLECGLTGGEQNTGRGNWLQANDDGTWQCGAEQCTDKKRGGRGNTYLLTYKETPVLVKEEVVQKKKVETFAISNASLLYFDGSYRRSHDAASSGIVVYNAQGNLVRKQGLKLDAKSNNEAEYMALEGDLHICLQMGIKRLQIKEDALLVVKQVLGVWKNKNPKLKNLCFKVKALLKKFEAWSL
ncbi:hypothetical protein L7F22_055049 [Adiantum nelumboides]|nr:hypothetical protein [Adiantum nelumboides]